MSVQNDNEKLIEEIATDAANSVGGYARPGYATYDAAERAVRAAFEKAHTPTDDEREALAWGLMEIDGYRLARVAAIRNGTLDVYLAKADMALKHGIGFRGSEVQEPSAHECEFGCASDEEHLRRAYEALRSEYEGYREWVRIAFTHNIAEADAKKIASRYVWHMTPSGGGLRNSAKAMQAALSEYIKLRVEAAHAAQGSKGA